MQLCVHTNSDARQLASDLCCAWVYMIQVTMAAERKQTLLWVC